MMDTLILSSPSSIRIQSCVVEDLEGLKSLGPAWDALAAGRNSPLLTHDWFLSAAEAFGGTGRLRIAVVRAGDEVTAIAPLMLESHLGKEHLELLGSGILCEPGGFLYRDEISLHQVISAVTSMRLPLAIRRILTDYPESRALRSASGSGPFWNLVSTSACPWIPINTDWPGFERQISASRRSAFRRARRHAEALGRVSVEFIEPDLAELDGLLDEVFAVETSGWKARNGTSLQTDQALGTFFRRYSRRAAEKGILRLCFFRIDGRAVAVEIAVEYARRFWVLKIGFDEAMAHCSPGILLTHETIKFAFDRHLETFEFLGEDEPWIRVWTDHTHCCETHLMYPVSFKGILSLGIGCSRVALNKIRARTARKHHESGGVS